MKTLIASLLLCCSLPLTVFAAGASDDWSYLFYLQVEKGVLAVDSTSDIPYTPIPDLYTSTDDPTKTDFYGVIMSGKGKETARFGFNLPQTTVSLLGKDLFSVKAPFYANADHVDFYAKSGKKLFTISVKGSSFCDDNGTCNANVGETYLNCPSDCPPPPPVEIVAPPATEPSTTTTNTEVTNTQNSPINASSTVQPSTNNQKTPFNKTTITLLVLGGLSLVLIFILWKLRGFRDE